MAASISKGYTFGTTELVTNIKLHMLVDSAAIAGIVNAEIDAAAAIVDTKLAQITTAAKVSGAALTSLGSIPGGGGSVPAVNLDLDDLISYNQELLHYKNSLVFTV